MTEDVYVSRVRVEKLPGADRQAHLPCEDEPVVYGVHSEIADHYGLDPSVVTPRASTLDHVVAATAACLSGTLAGMLRARRIDANRDTFSTEAVGHVAVDEGTLVISRIEVAYELTAPSEHREAAERAHRLHCDRCPVAKTLAPAVPIETTLRFRASPDPGTGAPSTSARRARSST